MGWGDLNSVELSSKAGKLPAVAGKSSGKALGKIGSGNADTSDSLIRKQAVVLDMGEASREQGFRMNGCR